MKQKKHPQYFSAEPKGFEELANWVTKSDTIVAIELKEPIFNEYYISVCFPENDFMLA